MAPSSDMMEQPLPAILYSQYVEIRGEQNELLPRGLEVRVIAISTERVVCYSSLSFRMRKLTSNHEYQFMSKGQLFAVPPEYITLILEGQ